MDEVYTLEERVEQQESQATKKKKKKKNKKAASLIENKTVEETMKSEKADKNSSSSLSSNKVLNSLGNESRDEEGSVTMDTVGNISHAASTTQAVTNSRANTQSLWCTDVEQPVLLSTECEDSAFGDCSNTVGHSVCDVSMGSSEEESLAPSAKDLSKALQTSLFPPVDHAHESLPATDDAHALSNEHGDIMDSKASIDSVSEKKNSDYRTLKPQTINLFCTSVSDDSNVINECKVSDVSIKIGNEKDTTQTQQCDFVEEKSQETVNENILLHCTEEDKRFERTDNVNDFNVLPHKTKDPDFTDGHEKDLNALEENNKKTSGVPANLEHCGNLEVTDCGESTRLSTEEKDNSGALGHDSRLVGNNDISLHEKNQLKHDKEQIERPVIENNSPLIQLECFELGESVNYLEKQPRNTTEYIPHCAKEVGEFVGSFNSEATGHDVPCVTEREPGWSNVLEIFGTKGKTEEKLNSEVAIHERENSVFTEETQFVGGSIQLESESTDVENVTREACVDQNSIANYKSYIGQTSTQPGSVCLLEMDTLDQAKVQIENGNRSDNSSKNTHPAEVINPEGSEITESELATWSTRDFLANEEIQEATPDFIVGGGCQNSERCPISQAICVTTATETTKTQLPAFLSSSYSLIGTKRDFQLKENMNESNLNSISETVDNFQNEIEQAGTATQQAPLIATSDFDIETKQGKRPDLISLEPDDVIVEEHSKGAESSSEYDLAVSSETQASCLELNSDKVLSECEETNPKARSSLRNRQENDCRRTVGKDSEQSDVEHNWSISVFPVHEQATEPVEEPNKQRERKLSEGEDTHPFSYLETKDPSDKADDCELFKSQGNLRNPFSHENSAETFPTVQSIRDAICPATCVVVSPAQKEIDEKPEAGSNATSEGWKVDYVTSRDKAVSLHSKAKLATNEQRKEEIEVLLATKIDESKQIKVDDKEEGEITSDEDDASETRKQSRKEREEGELSSSDSDVEVGVEASSQVTQQGTAHPKSKVTEGKDEFKRIEKELHLSKRHSSTELRQKSSKEKTRLPENSRHDGRPSLSSTKTSDLRTKLSQIRKKVSPLKSGPSSTSDTRARDRLRGIRSGEKQMTNSAVRKGCDEKRSRQGKVMHNELKPVSKTNTKNGKLKESPQTKKRHAGKHSRVTGSSGGECKPVSIQRSDVTKVSNKTTKEKASISLQEGDDMPKKVRPTNSRHVIEGSSHNSQPKPKKMTQKSTALRESECKINKRNSHSFESHETKVMAKESTIVLDTSVEKSSYNSGSKKATKDSQSIPRPKTKAKACSKVSDSGRLLSRVTVENTKGKNATGKCALRSSEVDKHACKSSDERTLGRHSETETTATVSTHAKSGSESDKGGREKASSVILSSQPKGQSMSGGNPRVRDKPKAVGASAERQQGHSNKGKSKQARTTVKVSPRSAPRKALKKLPSNVTSKDKTQPEYGKTGSTRKRRRVGDGTESRQAKKLRLEEENDPSKLLPKGAATTEIPQSNLKHGEDSSKRGNQQPTCKIHLPETRMVHESGDKLKSTKDLTYLDDFKENSNEVHNTQLKTVLIGRNKCLVFKHRHVNQLFVRGDNVVMVAYAK